MSAKPTPAPDKKNKKKKMLLIAAGAAVVLAGAGIGGYFMFAGGDEAEKVVQLPAQYHALSPAFVVNLADTDSTRYLQADVQLMTRDPETLTALKLHDPAIRNRLLLLFGSQTWSALAERAGKEALQKQALAEVRAVLKSEKAPDKVEALYFTSFATQ